MKDPRSIYNRITLGILLLYLIPSFLYTTFSVGKLSFSESWQLFIVGVLLSMSGSIALILSVRSFAVHLLQGKKTEASDQIQDYLVTINNLKESLAASQKKEQALQETWRKEQESIESAKAENFIASNSLQDDYQKKIREQQALLEERQNCITELDSKVRDLHYEIKTLLKLNIDNLDKDNKKPVQNDFLKLSTPVPQPPYSFPKEQKPMMSSQVSSSEAKEVILQLNRCVDIAQGLTGTNLLGGGTSLFRDYSIDSYVLDLRRLLEILRNESPNVILLYSRRENKLLFVNDEIKELLGWGAEKFLQNFSNIIQSGHEKWTRAVRSSSEIEFEFCLKMKSKAGEILPINCCLRSIPSGIFKEHVIAIMYPALSKQL
jgi:hypothetical protein